ncbi:hypothetical protein BKA70DRAFT_1540497, partial [Coprinopsis sp. MPI-PUGE-AT-0042]
CPTLLRLFGAARLSPTRLLTFLPLPSHPSRPLGLQNEQLEGSRMPTMCRHPLHPCPPSAIPSSKKQKTTMEPPSSPYHLQSPTSISSTSRRPPAMTNRLKPKPKRTTSVLSYSNKQLTTLAGRSATFCSSSLTVPGEEATPTSMRRWSPVSSRHARQTMPLRSLTSG